MAEERPDQILIEVTIDEQAVEQKIVDLRKQVIGLKADKESLRKENRAGTISSDDFAKGLTKANIAINEANKAIRENEKTLTNSTTARKAAEGSLVQLRAQLSLDTAAWDALSEAERTNDKIGGVIKDRINSVTDVLKDQEEQTGRTYRLVGSYAASLEQAITGNSTWSGKIKGSVAALKEAKEGLSQYVQGLKGTTEGMNGAQKASVALGLGLKAIGIGLLLQAIAGLIAFLSKMDAGMDKVEQATAAVSAGFENLLQTIAPIGEAIVNAFSVEGIKAFGEALLHPIDSLKKLIQGSKDFADDIATNVGKAASAAVDYTKAIQDLEDEQDGLILQQAKVNAQVAKALLATKDRSKTEKERIKLLDDAGKAELDLANKTVSIRQRELDALVDFQKSKKKLQDADRKQLGEAQAAVINAAAASEQTEQQIQNRRSALREQDAADAKAKADKALEQAKKRAEELLALEERKLIEAKRVGKDTLAIEEDIIKRQLAVDLVGVAKNSQQRKLLIAKSNADILDAQVKHATEVADRTLEIGQARLNAQLLLVQHGSKQELDLQKKALTDQLDFDKARAVDTIKNKQQLTAKLRLLDAKYNADTEQLQDAFDKAQLDRKHELDRQRLQAEIDLSQETYLVMFDNQRKQIDLEERQALALLKLDEETARARGQLTTELQNELLVRQNTIQAKAIAARRALAQQELEQEKANAVALAEAGLAALNEGSFKYLQAQKKLLKARHDQELANAKLTKEEKEKIDAEYNKNRKKLDEDFAKDLANQIISTASLATDGLSTAFEAQAAAASNSLQQQQDAAVKSAGANADLRARIEEKFTKKKEALDKEAARKKQKIASIENIIATAQASTAALELFAKNPILGAITELLVLAKAVANQKLIDQQQFDDGGVYLSDGNGGLIKGPGTGKSDSINSRLSNGESVLTALATDMFYDDLSAMNVLGGGKPFPGAEAPEMPLMAGFSMGGVAKSGGQDLMQVVEAIKGLNIFVAVTDIDSVKDDMVKAKAVGDY